MADGFNRLIFMETTVAAMFSDKELISFREIFQTIVDYFMSFPRLLNRSLELLRGVF